jgi:hypothetical protein
MTAASKLEPCSRRVRITLAGEVGSEKHPVKLRVVPGVEVLEYPELDFRRLHSPRPVELMGIHPHHNPLTG